MKKNAVKTYSSMPGHNDGSRFIPCPLCGSMDFRRIWLIKGATFSSCVNCSLVMQNPQPGALRSRYDKSYFEYEIENEDVFFQLMMKGLSDVRFFDSIEPTLPPFRRILDIGCATGKFLSHFKKLGWETAGCDLCQQSVEYGNRKYNAGIVKKTLSEAAFPASHFSLIHASHLIEHVEEPAAFLGEVCRIMSPGGVFLCVTPDICGFQARLFGSSWRSVIPDHVTLFSRYHLGRMLELSGFRVEQKKSWGGMAKGTAPVWLKKIIDSLAKRWNCGDVMLVVARKERDTDSEKTNSQVIFQG